MMFRKKRGTQKQNVVVVLEGIKASKENIGVAPLSLALHDVVKPEDQVLVLTLLHWNVNPPPAAAAAAATASAGPSSSSNENKLSIQTCELLINPNSKFLYQEISQRKETYAKIFKPFYLYCEEYGVSILLINVLNLNHFDDLSNVIHLLVPYKVCTQLLASNKSAASCLSIEIGNHRRGDYVGPIIRGSS